MLASQEGLCYIELVKWMLLEISIQPLRGEW